MRSVVFCIDVIAAVFGMQAEVEKVKAQAAALQAKSKATVAEEAEQKAERLSVELSDVTTPVQKLINQACTAACTNSAS